jgi:hypothetical protein
MLTIQGGRQTGFCDGVSRRDFLRVGALGMGGLTLPGLLQAKAQPGGARVKNKSVIWVWLSGGPTHVETFDPKMTAPAEYRSITGECKTPIPGVTVGGTFPEIASVADKMSFVRSFSHGSGSHGTGTTLVMTGYNDRGNMRPSMGSILSKARGTTHAETGMPTYVKMGNIRSDGPGWLGARYTALSPSGQARKNMDLSVDMERSHGRRGLLGDIDKLRRDVDSTGKMEGLDGFEQQAFDLVMGDSAQAFDVKKEDSKTRKRYGKGLGEQLLLARRLCEAGCGFVTVNYGGWDMHGGIVKGLKTRARPLDQGVSALIRDLGERGMLDDVLVVVTGEFGRTPKINSKGGRDHWGKLCTLAMAGGGLRMGQVIGESSPKVEVPASNPIGPQDLMATVMHMYGMNPKMQLVDHQGRPTYLVENGRPIPQLLG